MATRIFLLLLATVPLIPFIWIDHWGDDYFFLAESTRLFLTGVSPYTDEISQAIYSETCPHCAGSGFAYPLPALLLVLPFAWLPHKVGAILFIACSVGLVVWCLDQLDIPPIALLFMPAALASLYGNPTIMITGLILLGVVLLQRQSWRMLGIVVVLLLAVKPQTALVIALYFMWQLWQVRRLHYALVPGMALLLASLAVLPTWPLEWLEQLSAYQENQFIYFPWFLAPVALYLFSKGWHYPGLALLQASLPANASIYIFSPMLVSLVGRPRLVWPLLVGTGLWHIADFVFPDYYTPEPLLIPIVVLFALDPVLQKYQERRERTAQQHHAAALERVPHTEQRQY